MDRVFPPKKQNPYSTIALIALFISIAIMLVAFGLSFLSKDKVKVNPIEKSENAPIVKAVFTGPTSYWYVVVEKKNQGTKLSQCISLNHEHFSIKEAKATFGDPKEIFILSFIQVSEATYIDYNSK